jgi:hypothetical protein
MPYSWMVYAKIAFTGTPTAADLKGIAGALGTVYKSLQEKDPNGKLVKTVELGATWGMSSLTKAGELNVVTMKLTDGSLTVELSFIASNVVGQIAYGSALVSPRSLQCIIEITGYSYANPLNHLELGIAVATVDSKFKGNAIISKKEGSDVYFTLADWAIINGTEMDVQITKYVEGTLGNLVLEGVLKGILKTDLQVRETTIIFAPGAAKIIYDPSFGNGKVLYGAASGLVPSILLLALLALFLL